MFCWQVDNLLKLFKKCLPKHYSSLMKIYKAIGTGQEKQTIQKEFTKMKAISIDYGIMEKTKKILVVPANFSWADIGHWKAVKDILAKKVDDNVVRGNHLTVDSKDNLIYSYTGRLIATAGISNSVIIDMEDCVLVCNKDKAQDVKKIVNLLEKKNMKKYL